MLIGGWIIAAGHITLAASEVFGITAGEVVTLQTGPGALLVFMLGLFLIVVGTGFFKPCVSVMVGQLYEHGDPRRDSGFTIFYMGINLGAFFSPLVAGTLGEKVGWHWGFGSAAVGMIAGLIFYQIFRPRYLKGIGLPPGRYEKGEEDKGSELVDVCTACDYPLHGEGTSCPACGATTRTKITRDELFNRPLKTRDFHRLLVIIILAFFGNIFFWTAFEQAGSSMNVFANENTDRTVPFIMVQPKAQNDAAAPEGAPAESPPAAQGSKVPWQFPATWYQSINPLAIILFAPIFAWLWVFLDRRKLNPSTPLKFALGLYLLGLAFLAMVFGAMDAKDGLAAPHWLLITYLVVTWGELCLSPVGLSMVTKLAPPKLQSLMMGLWFFSFSLANLFAGLVAAFSVQVKEGKINFLIDGLPGFFLMLVVFPLGAGFIIMLASPFLRRLMHGIK
jgi:POT family proton-dependent oligopeptide transporter